MYSIVAILAFVGVSAASKCCIPPQWTASAGFLTTLVHNGKPIKATGRILMAYDSVNKKVGQYEILSSENMLQGSYGVMFDYNNNMKYTIDDKGLCYKTALNRDIAEFGGCIPDNATRVGDGNVLGIGSNSLTVDTYFMELGSVGAYIAVTDNCIPVMETIRGSVDGNMVIQNLHILNITAGIPDPTSLQVPPKGCENAVQFEGHYTGGNFMTNPVGRRSFFLGF